MTFFETLLALLLVAVVLLQLARRLRLPYPGMLVLAGVAIGLLPGTPGVALEPATALALFLAPAVLDAAFDFPLGSARRYWAPLVAFAFFAVIVTTAVVAWLGWALAGLPVAAAIALGAIVAPPDAAAATATLGNVSIPRNTDAVLRGESLFNDATSLLIFGAALSVQSAGGLHAGVGLQLALAVPGGLLLGVAAAYGVRYLQRFVTATLRGNLLQFVSAYLVWIAAEHLHLSAVLAEVAFGMTLARSDTLSRSVRNRVHSLAVWLTVVFLLNVFAFLFMGMQARIILGRLAPAQLVEAARFAGIVVATVVVVRLVMVIGYNRLSAWMRRRRGLEPLASVKQAVFVGWSGMRGLVTLATAFALPLDFPNRDLVVLTAFAVVLTTLVVQGFTLLPLVHLLGLDQRDAVERERAEARAALVAAGLEAIAGKPGREAEHLRHEYELRQPLAEPGSQPEHGPAEARRSLGLAALAAERERLEALRQQHQISAGTYDVLQEELDWRELALLPDDARRIEEG